MNKEEVALRIKNFIFNTIDLYFQPMNLGGKLKNSTAKFWVDQNFYKIRNIICMFADETGNIDINKMKEYYKSSLFDNNGEFKLDVKTILPEDMTMLRGILPDKILLFREDDLESIFK